MRYEIHLQNDCTMINLHIYLGGKKKQIFITVECYNMKANYLYKRDCVGGQCYEF